MQHEASFRIRLQWMCFFFFNDTATTEIYTLSLHDALPIYPCLARGFALMAIAIATFVIVLAVIASERMHRTKDRKSTRLNSSHANISYAVFCLKKKKTCQDFSLSGSCYIIFSYFTHAPRKW